MATQEQEIVVHAANSSETSLSPIVLDRWQESLVKMDEFKVAADVLYQSAADLTVEDGASFQRAGELIASLKQVAAESEACMEPYKLTVRKVLDFIQQKFNKNKNRTEEARAILTRKMGDYSRKEREATAKEQKQMDRKGIEGTVQPNLPKTAGVRTTVNYPITIVDPKALLRALLKAYKATDTKRVQFLSQFVELNESALRTYAKEQKDPKKFNAEIPGVTCEAKEAFGGKV